jgi:hypothetical protein
MRDSIRSMGLVRVQRSGFSLSPGAAAVGLVFALAGQATWAGPLDTVVPGRWYEFPNSHMEDVRPPGVSASGTSAVMFAWGSGVLDTDLDRLVVWGGGHTDYDGNEIYAFGPINGTNPHWARLTNPSNPPANNTAHAPDGRPVSRHTYNLLTYLPAPLHKMMSCAIGSQHSNGFGTAGADFYDFAIDGMVGQPWSVAATPPSNAYPIGGFCIFNPITNRVWYHDNGSNNARLQQYNPASGTWNSHASFYFESYPTPAVDWTRNRLVATGAFVNGQNGVTLVWDLAHPDVAPVIANVSGPTNAAVGPAPGFVYDPSGDRFLGWNGGAKVYALAIPANAQTGIWTWSEIALDPGNTVMPTRVAHVSPGAGDYDTGTYGRFRYVPSAHGLIVVNATNENVYFFKLPGAPTAAMIFADEFEGG